MDFKIFSVILYHLLIPTYPYYVFIQYKKHQFQFSPSLLFCFKDQNRIYVVFPYITLLYHTHTRTKILNSNYLYTQHVFLLDLFLAIVLIKWISTKNPRGQNQIKLYSTYFNLIKYYPRKSSTSFLGRFMIPRLWWFIEGKVLMGPPKFIR